MVENVIWQHQYRSAVPLPHSSAR